MRYIDQDWQIDVQGVALLNCTSTSTLVSGNALEVANARLARTTATSDTAEAYYAFLWELVGQAEETLQQVRRNLGNYDIYRVRNQAETTPSLVERDHQQVRTIVLQEANTKIMVQHLAENRVQQIMVAGDCNLARSICEVMADAIDYPLFHTKIVHCHQLLINDQNLTFAPSFRQLVDMHILTAQQPLVGNGFEYGLATQFHSK